MKIKSDFVTNSSSTCYVLTSIVSGHLPRLSGEYLLLKEFYEDQDHLYKGYAHVTIKNGPGDINYFESEPVYDMDLFMNDGRIYDENSNEKSITYFQLRLLNHTPYQFEQTKLVTDVIERILFKELKENIKPSQMMYFAYPSDVWGDGWDGGDPQGPSNEHINIHDLNKAETKMGILTIANSKVVAELQTIESSLNLNRAILEKLNADGFCLEEQNDKNS